jgi:hypothetical protein
MKKRTYFDKFDRRGWPALHELEPFFLAPKGKEWSYQGGNDSWGLMLEGLEGTEHLEYGDRHRIDVDLEMTGHPKHGLFLYYAKYGGGYQERFFSKGDLSHLKDHVRTLHSDLRPIGLFIPFKEAWKAVKEFIETEGDLPKSIEWISSEDLPPDTFPPPWAKTG